MQDIRNGKLISYRFSGKKGRSSSQLHFRQVDWLKFLNTVLKRGKVTVTGDFKVTVVSAGYFKAGLRVMNHTDG